MHENRNSMYLPICAEARMATVKMNTFILAFFVFKQGQSRVLCKGINIYVASLLRKIELNNSSLLETIVWVYEFYDGPIFPLVVSLDHRIMNN